MAAANASTVNDNAAAALALMTSSRKIAKPVTGVICMIVATPSIVQAPPLN